MRRGKLGQTEMIGLAVIVILLMVGLIFIVRFVVMKQPTSIKQTFTQSNIASNFVNSMLKMSAEECTKNVDMSDLIANCAKPKGNPIRCTDLSSSCDFVNRTVKALLDNSIKRAEWGSRAYLLNMYVHDPNVPLHGIQHANKMHLCKERDSKIFPIPLNPGSVKVQLWICS